MGLIEMLAERRIQQAMREGAFDHLEGAGRPLKLEDDDPFVPPELRMAFKVMKNAGLLPPEVLARKEIHSLRELIACTDDEAEAELANRRLQYLLMQLDARGSGRILAEEARYRRALGRRMERASLDP